MNDIAMHRGATWRGEILIVKTNSLGLPVDVDDGDRCFLPIILKK